MANTPKSIVYIRPDTLGDLVIFSSALQQLQNAWPNARHTLVVRPGYDDLAPLFAPTLHWQTIAVNPFTQKPATVRELLDAAVGRLAENAPDLIVAPTLNRTWLEVALAARFPQARRVALGARAVDPLFAMALRLELGIEAAEVFPEIVPVIEGERDWENNHRLVDQLFGRATLRSMPNLRVADAARAREILVAAGFADREWAAVFPGGMANVPIKAWPTSRFAELVRWLRDARGLPVLLLGHVAEKPILESIASAARDTGDSQLAVWCGEDGEIPLLAALLSQARLYVGHDTGAMHMAAALGRPTVGIFGGGHWPRFRPVGRQVVSVVQPLPCFGCNWDCYFGDAPCVKTIATADVQRGVERALRDALPCDEVIVAQHVSEEALRFIAAVKPRYAALQNDRLERQHKIEELKREADLKDGEIDSLKAETDTKDQEIAALKNETDGKDREIDGLKRETTGKDEEITALKRSAEERRTEMESIKAELEAECATKDDEIAALKAAANAKDAEIVALKKVCDEREALIILQAGHIKRFQAAEVDFKQSIERLEAERLRLVDELRKLGAQLEAQISEAEQAAPKLTRGAQLEKWFAALSSDAAQWPQQVYDKEVHIQNLEKMLADRDRELVKLQAGMRERETSLNHYAAGFASLELSKHYGKLLAEKESVIQSLHRACVEREGVIKQLALDAAGPAGQLNKLWIATCAHVRVKYWLPFNEWLFKKVVEDYWMQIGILEHYPPRPIQWDKFPKPKLSPEKLPQIGIVTPSFQQATYIESTMLSVLNQRYPRLRYVVQDGASKDASPKIIARYADRLHHWESTPDKGQADAIRKGFSHLVDLGPTDVMAWLNSDDFISPRALRFIGEYFARHPEIDVVYGHRIIIDGDDREIGRWIMPRHDPKTLEWIDYVPQETLFWRKRIWDRVGGIDPSFQFALDWDLLARYQQAGARIARLPYFLGCFRVHREQKTSQHIHTIGNDEMIRIRSRFHGDRHSDFETINRYARKARFTGALTARLAALGIRF